MRYAAAVVLGLLSAVLVYMLVMMMVPDPERAGGAFAAVVLLGAWGLSVALFVQGTQTTARVVRRACLIGACEWLALIPVGMVTAGQAVNEIAAGGTDAELAGATIGAGIGWAMMSAIGIGGAVVCLVVYAIAYFMGRDMRAERQPEPTS